MTLHIRNLIDDEYLKKYFASLRYYFKKTLKVLDIDDDYDLSLILCDEAMIYSLNLEYRNIDRPTDVLTFASIDDDEALDDKYLGDIFINEKAVYDQAKEYGHSIKREFCFLFVHGLLHTLGYDHMTKEDEEVMFNLQKRILKDLK